MNKQGSSVAIKIANYLKEITWKEGNSRNCVTASVNLNSEVRWESAKPFEEIPSAMILPFIGTAWQSMPIIGRYDPDRRHVANRDKRKRFGNIVRERFGAHNAVLCFTVEDLESVLKSEGRYPHTLEISSIKVYRESRKELFSSLGLLALQGKEWHELRSKTQKHLLKPMAVQEYLEPMQEVAKDFVKRIYDVRDANFELPDLNKEICKWSLESVSFVGLDTRLGCLKRNLPPDSDGTKMVEAAMTISDCKTKLEAFTGYLQFWKLFSTPTWRKFTNANDVYSMIAFKYIHIALTDLINGTAPKNKLTLLQAMLAKRDLSVSDAVVFVADLMMAGLETTSHATGFLLYHLARNPEKQELLYEEVMRLLPTDDTKLTPTVFESFKYLKACWKESMRLTPIIAGNGRILAQDAVLSGYRVPAGTIAVVFYEDIYMDEALFKDPSKFLPERWLNRNEKPPKFAFIPFGFGPRSCIGRRLAEIKTVALISEIVRNFKIEYRFEEVGIHSKLLNVPDRPLRINFIERLPKCSAF